MIKLKVVGSVYHVELFKKVFHGTDLHIVDDIDEAQIVYQIYGVLSKVMLYSMMIHPNKKHIFHWIGTDVLMCKNYDINNPKIFIKSMLSFVYNRAIHFSGSEWLKDELSQKCISSIYVPPIIDINPDIIPREFKEDNNIVTYIPEYRKNFYGFETFVKIANKNRDVNFDVLALEENVNLPNVNVHGWVARDEVFRLYQNSKALLRIPIHDGLSFSVLEALLMGRYVIWNQNFPNVFFVKNETDIQNSLDKIKNLNEPNFEGRDYVIENFNQNKLCENFVDSLKSIL